MAGQRGAVNVVWKPWGGGQTQYLTCPITEKFAEGNRGGGKTELALVDFSQFVGQFGSAWRGVIFRREYKHLEDVAFKAKRLFRQVFPEAKFNSSKSDYKYVWPTGEELLFRVGKKTEDYWNYHGHEFPFVHFEELTNWPDDGFYEAMKSCNRGSVEGMPRIFSSNANPFGAGHGWVKKRFIDIGPPKTVAVDDEGLQRVRIHVDLKDNKALLDNDPNYVKRLAGIKNDHLRKAWSDGNWDIVVGGFLQGIWDRDVHVVKPFAIPHDWPRWRCMDWGSARPYSIGWYTKSPEGVIYRYRELYGDGGEPNVGTRENASQVAKRVLQVEAQERKAKIVFRRNPADSSIWNDDGRIITVERLFSDENVRWVKAQKGPGSRVSGAQVVIDYLTARTFKVFDTCQHFIRTVPVLMPDPDNWEDIDTDMEDHVWDEVRYSLTSRHRGPQIKQANSEPKPGTFDHLLKITAKTKRKSTYRMD